MSLVNGLSIVVALLGSAVVWLLLSQQRLSREVDRAQHSLSSLQTELQALYAGAAGVGTHLARVESQLKSLSDRQDQIDVRDPAVQTYKQAISMIQQGAGIDEIISHCGLLREEAELLQRLHGDQAVDA